MDISPSALIIANCSGFWGDRFSAAEEMVRGGPIDVLTGDYLAELSMAILHKRRQKDPRGGFVPTFLQQLERVLGECLDRGIKIVSNAGGLDPRGLAEAIDAVAHKLGLHPKVAFVDGDDLGPRLPELMQKGERFVHLDHGTPLAEAGRPVVTANAYLGGWGIRDALARGADVVVTGRVTDAALVVGPAAWRFGWRRDDWDRLAGAVAAGHVIECSAQATGGNYSFFEEVPSFDRIGFPICEMREDGSFVITKHPSTGGLVSVGTVTAQLLYEIQGPAYANPDVTAHFDTCRLSQLGPDRVLVDGTKGSPPPAELKVSINCFGGYRNSMSILLGGLDLDEKARIVEAQLFGALGGKEQFSHVETRLLRMDREPAQANEEAVAYLQVTVLSPDEKRVGRRFANAVVELALSSVPGFSARTPPADATPYLVFWPALVSRAHVDERVHVDGETIVVAPPPAFSSSAVSESGVSGSGISGVSGSGVPPARDSRVSGSGVPPAREQSPREPYASAAAAPEKTVRIPLGTLFGTRSGDKGGNASLGIWARSDDAWTFLRDHLTVARLIDLCPDFAPFSVERQLLPNLKALLFVLHGFLGEGVAASTRVDPQAKTLGEYVRSRPLDVPAALVR